MRAVVLGSVAAALAVVESFLPRPVPWVRLGLGHSAVLIAIWVDGPSSGLLALAVKVLVAGLVAGTLFQPVAAISAVAGLGAWTAMSLVYLVCVEPSGGRLLGPVGVSAAGSLVHGLLQIWLIGVWLAGSPLWTWAPLVVIPSVVAGTATGLISALVLERLGMLRQEGGRAQESR